MNERKKGVIISYLYTSLHVVINIIYVPVLISNLGDEEYGLYQIVASLFTYITIFESGISVSVTRFYCEAISQNDEEKKENVLAIARKIYWLLSILILFIGIGLIFIFRVIYNDSFTVTQLDESGWMLSILIFNYIITMVNLPYVAAINAHEKFSFLKLIAILNQILQPVVCVIVLNNYPFALSVVMVQFIISIAMIIVRWFFARYKLNIRIVFHYFDKSLAKNILQLSGSFLLASLADQIFWKTDQLILGKMLGATAVAIYSVGSHIYLNYMSVGITISSVFLPKLTKLKMEGKFDEISALFVSVGRISFQVLLLVLSGFFIFGKEFVELWVGNEYMDAYFVALIIMIPFTIDIMQNLGLTILQIMDKYSFRARIYLFGAILNIISTILMVYYFGNLGAAISTGVTMFIVSGVILNIYYYKVVGLDIKEFWKNIGIIFLKLLPVIIIGYILNCHVLLTQVSFSLLILKILIYSIIYSVALRCIVLNDVEKKYINDVISRFISKKRIN